MKKEKCKICNGDGYTTEHDIPANHGEYGECLTCPVQVQCEKCEGTGYNLTQPIINKDMKTRKQNLLKALLNTIGQKKVCDSLADINKAFDILEKALIREIKSKIDKEIERWEKVDEESSSYKISALYDLRKKL